jgi:uncharacterized protein (DUF2384 family)
MGSGMSSDTHLLRKSAGKAGELLQVIDWYDDVKFLQIFMALHSNCGGDEVLMRHWMQTPNTHLQSGVPANLITTEQGIQDVLDYVLYLTH